MLKERMEIVEELRNGLERGERMLIAVDGLGGSGKSTLADLISREIPAFDIVRMDDFYLPSEERRRRGYHGYDIDRIIDEVITPFMRGEPPRYSRYDWTKDRTEGEYSPSGSFLIIEGVYSTCEKLRSYYQKKIWVDAHRDIRLHRGLVRDGEGAYRRWVEEWMPLEDKYVEEQNPRREADYVMDTDPF